MRFNQIIQYEAVEEPVIQKSDLEATDPAVRSAAMQVQRAQEQLLKAQENLNKAKLNASRKRQTQLAQKTANTMQ